VTVVTAHCSGNRLHLVFGNGQRRNLVKVNRARTAIVLGAVLLWAATPPMTCLLPGFARTTAELECCHRMAEHCGQSAMPASHGCCRAPNHPEALVVQGQANLPPKNVVAAVPNTTHLHLPAVIATSLMSLAFCESPPGQPLSCSSSVLRI